jgi:hypothetical protein
MHFSNLAVVVSAFLVTVALTAPTVVNGKDLIARDSGYESAEEWGKQLLGQHHRRLHQRSLTSWWRSQQQENKRQWV